MGHHFTDTSLPGELWITTSQTTNHYKFLSVPSINSNQCLSLETIILVTMFILTVSVPSLAKLNKIIINILLQIVINAIRSDYKFSTKLS